LVDATGVDAWETLLIQSKEDDAPPCYHLVEKYSTDVLGDIEHFAFPRGEPGHLSGSVTLGAVAVATGIITDLLVATVVTLGFVAPQGGGTADGDGAQGPTLLCREGSAIACQEEVAILLDHIRHFEAWAGHTSVSSGNASSGLGVACRACGVTWR
jgi:hypothetical protein